MYLTTADKKQLMQECGDASLILFEYYLSKAGIEEYDFADDKVAKSLGWGIRKVQETRKRLIKAGYFAQQHGKYSNGNKIVTTYLGKETINSTFKKEIDSNVKTDTPIKNDE